MSARQTDMLYDDRDNQTGALLIIATKKKVLLLLLDRTHALTISFGTKRKQACAYI